MEPPALISFFHGNYEYDHTHTKHSIKETNKEKRPRIVLQWLILTYMIFMILWVIILALLEIPIYDVFFILLISIPIVLFIYNMMNVSELTGEIEEKVFPMDFVSIGIIIAVPLMTFLMKDYKGPKYTLFSIFGVMLSLALLSMISVWTSYMKLIVVKHIKSALQTISITLALVALYTYKVHNYSSTEENVTNTH